LLGKMNDYRVIGRTVLRGEDSSHSFWVIGVSAEPVHRFSGKDRQMAPRECAGRLCRTADFAHGRTLAVGVFAQLCKGTVKIVFGLSQFVSFVEPNLRRFALMVTGNKPGGMK
jgi:hypothetical protein